MNENTKARRPKGYKPFWEDDEEVEQAQPEVEEQEEKKPERFKMIKGIVRGGGLNSVFKKKV